MKKVLLVVVLVLGAISVKADPQVIITDCGTVHQIPDDATVEEAIKELDKWSKKDCQDEEDHEQENAE